MLQFQNSMLLCDKAMDRRDGSNCLRHKEDRRRDSDNRRRQGTTCVGREEKRQSRVASYVRDGVNLHRGKANLE